MEEKKQIELTEEEYEVVMYCLYGKTCFPLKTKSYKYGENLYNKWNTGERYRKAMDISERVFKSMLSKLTK